MAFVGQPAPPLGHIGPGPDIGQTFGEGVNVAFCPVNPANLTGEPILRNVAILMQEVVDLAQKRRVFAPADATKIRNPADIPQELDRFAIAGAGRHLGIGGESAKRRQIVRFPHAGEPAVVGFSLKALHQAADRAELQRRIAPMELFNGSELVVLDRLDHIGIKLGRLACHTECAVAHVPPRSAGYLSKLIGRERAHPVAVELG